LITLSKEVRALQKKAYQFAQEHFLANEEAWEERGAFPSETFSNIVQAGYSGLLTPQAFGGKGHTYLEATLIYEAFARGSFPLTFALGVHNVVGLKLSQEKIHNPQVKDIIRKINNGENIVGIALTEANAGSDPASLETTASLQGDKYILNGQKKWVTNGKEADYIAVVAKEEAHPKNTLMLLVDTRNEGVEIVDSPRKSAANFVSTPTIQFTNCVIADKMLISEHGLSAALQTIDYARLSVAAYCMGLSQEALDITTKYVSDRVQFGRPIIQNQGIQWKLAELQTEIEASRWFIYHVASLIDAGEMPSTKIAMAKLKASNVAMRVTVECAQLFGANGMLTSHPLARYINYAKMSEIVDGTSEIQKLIIGGNIAKEALKNK